MINVRNLFFTKQKTKVFLSEGECKRRDWTYPVQVGIRILWHVVVENDVDPLDVHSSAEQIGRHQDSPLEVLELLITRQSGEEKPNTNMINTIVSKPAFSKQQFLLSSTQNAVTGSE